MAGRSHRMWGAVLAVATLLGGLVATGSPARAVVASTSGAVVKIAPPADVRPGGICSTSQIFAFDELQGVTLAAPVKYDMIDVGTYQSAQKVKTLPAGTVVDSHFLDSNGACATNWREGTWKFSQDILGVIVDRDRLNNSDWLGSPTTEYGGAYPSREFDWGLTGTADLVQIIDSRTIYVKVHTGGNTDQMRVLTKHNEQPVPNANGPYAGNEGSNVTLNGTVTDPDGDPVTTSWSFVKSASGTTCTYTNTTTLTPTINCNDDTLITATLTVNDGFHSAVTSIAYVTIANKAPTITSVTVPAGPIALGSAANLSAVFADAGSHDTHGSSSVAWGDTNSSTPLVNEPGHSLSASHVYALPGTYSVTVTVNDDDGGTVSDSTKTITVVGPPTAGAGGDKNGNEGSTISLFGSASSTLPLTKSWTFTPGPADAGTACTYTGTTTLTPTVKCNDDVVVAAQLTVNDGVNAPVTDTSNVTVDNEAPVLSPLTATADPIVAGQLVTVSGTFTDVGTNDTHTSTVDWGDLSTSAATVTESLGSGSASATHSYASPGLYSVAVDVNDGDGGIATRYVQIRVNTPPTADAGGPYAGPEGSLLTLGGTASDPDPDVLTTNWSFVVSGAPPSACTFGATNTVAPTVQCTDNASIAATLSVSDGVHAPVSSVATLTVGNVAPTVGALGVTPSIQAVGANVSVSASFADVGTNDTHSALVDWGDASSSDASVTESAGAGTATASHVYADAGIYTVAMTVTDDDAGAATVSTTVVVYDPSGPFVTASGKFSSPSGAYTPDNQSDPNVVGTAQMQFVAKYHTGDTVPTGNGSFKFEAAGLDLDATGFVWLVVTPAGDEAFFRGTGTVNGVPGYEFLVSGIDGSPDLVRIKVWQTSSGTVVYDSQPGAADDADPTTALTSGQFIVH